MMDNLIIGSTSQLSNYFPKEYLRISSREIDYNSLKKQKYNRIYILFSEQRTFIENNNSLFYQTNVLKTMEVINELKDYCINIVVFATSELWNNCNGCIDLKTPFNYNHTPYIKSKEDLVNHIQNNRNIYDNVIIVYPFNFNSIYRKPGFLFYKVFDSLINLNKNSIGDVNFNRDLIHPRIVANKSIETNCDIIVGSGELINVQNFIIDLFRIHNVNINEYLTIDSKNNLSTIRNEYYSCNKLSTYDEIIKLTLEDLCQLN